MPSHAVARPVLLALYVHGGGMTSGSKTDLNPVFLDALKSHGFAVATLNYRLAPGYRFPAQIEDVKCAIRFLRANAHRYGLDRNEFFAFGTSVGGQLVALAALTGSHSAWDVGPRRTEPSNLRAVADMFGPANLTQPASGFSPSGIETVFGRMDRRLLVAASPTHYVAPNAPPILLVQGTDDTKVLKSQSVELYRDLKAAGDTTQLLMVRGMGHMFTQAGAAPIAPSIERIARDMVRFFERARGV
jgi:acetyl esterase/lipase